MGQKKISTYCDCSAAVHNVCMYTSIDSSIPLCELVTNLTSAITSCDKSEESHSDLSLKVKT